MADQDLIQRLLEFERQAENLVKDAEQEAERRKAAARESETGKYQGALAARNRELEEKLESAVEGFRSERERKVIAFIEDLRTTRLNPERLNSTLEEIIKKGVL